MHKREYLDFDLEIERATQGYRAEVDGPAGQSTTTFTLPFSNLELENFLLKIGYVRRGMRRIDSPEVAALKTFGAQLFEAVFVDELRACLRSSLEEAADQGAGLRIRLRLNDTPELADIPWEYLYHPTLNRFLALSVETPLVRYLELPTRVRQLAVTPPLRMLAMISSPRGCPPLDVEREWAKLQKALGALIERGLVALERIPATLTALQQQLRRAEYHMLHFVGHGTFDERTQEGALLLEDADRERDLVSAQDLGTLLHDHRTLRLVMLNACEGGRASRTDPFAGTAQSLIQQGIPAVIAMQFEVSDEAAIMLAHEFYGAVADGYPVDAALAEARKALFAAGSRVEWGTPVLYLRAPDGKIFDLARGDPGADPPTETRTFVPAGQGQRIPMVVDVPAQAPASPRSSTRELTARSERERPAQLAHPASQDALADRNRQRMLQKVRQFWIHGILEQSLDGVARIELGLASRAAAVDDPWSHVIQPPEQRANVIALGTSIAAIYDALGGALLILGAAGVGKTTTLLELADTLIARAEQDPTLAMPIVFNLSSWAVRRRPLAEWLVDELSTRYQVPRRIGQVWVDADQVLPLFDGLDEVAPEHRGACVVALNQFRAAHWLLDFVVCSREGDYAAQSTKLQVQGAIVVQPLTAAQVDAYLAQAGDQLAAVRTLLQEDAALRELADTPLMLSIMVLAYRGMVIDALRARGPLDERRAHVFDNYIRRMLSRRGASARYAPQQTLGWLTWLARNMVQRSQTIFFIEGLQPDWLPPVVRRWCYPALFGLVVGLLYGSSIVIPYEVNARSSVREIDGSIAGLIAGITALLITVLVLWKPPSQQALWRSIARGLGLGLAAGTFVGLVIGVALAPWYELVSGLETGLFVGSQNGIAVGLGLSLIGDPRIIASVETVRWSWHKALVEFKGRFAVVLSAALLAGLIPGLVAAIARNTEMGVNIGTGLALVTVVTMLLGLGLTAGEIETKTIPNQGIQRSARNAIRVGVLFLLVTGPALSVLFNAMFARDNLLPRDFGLGSAALPIAIMAGLVYGGFACLQHLVLRFLLSRSGVMPWNYARFLDEAAEHLLLRKVGGGYIFIHRLLLEHFAGRTVPPDERIAAPLMPVPTTEKRDV